MLNFMRNFLLVLLIQACDTKPAFVESRVYKWSDLEISMDGNILARKILNGPTPHFEFLQIEAISIISGANTQLENESEGKERLIIVKQGLMEISMDTLKSILGPESVIQIMPGQRHTIFNAGLDTLTYYVLKYDSRKPVDMVRAYSSGGSMIYNKDSLIFKPSKKGGGRKYFDRATAMCERFEMHVTHLSNRGPSHDGHTHLETEIILVIDGKANMTIDGVQFKSESGDLYFIASQLPHQVGNDSDESCTYFAFKWR